MTSLRGSGVAVGGVNDRGRGCGIGRKLLKPTFHLHCSLLISRVGRCARPAKLAFSQRFERLGQLITCLTALKLRTQILSFARCLATTDTSSVADMALHYVARRIRSVLPITREYPIRTDFANGIAT